MRHPACFIHVHSFRSALSPVAGVGKGGGDLLSCLEMHSDVLSGLPLYLLQLLFLPCSKSCLVLSNTPVSYFPVLLTKDTGTRCFFLFIARYLWESTFVTSSSEALQSGSQLMRYTLTRQLHKSLQENHQPITCYSD